MFLRLLNPGVAISRRCSYEMPALEQIWGASQAPDPRNLEDLTLPGLDTQILARFGGDGTTQHPLETSARRSGCR
jgi:hypothetical protein